MDRETEIFAQNAYDQIVRFRYGFVIIESALNAEF